MKKILKTLFVVLCLVSIVGCSKKENNNIDNKVSNNNDVKPINIKVTYKLDNIDNCTSGPKLYYKFDNRNIYLVCLNDVYVSKDKTLKDYLDIDKSNVSNKIKSIERTLTTSSDSISTYKDGGSKKYTNDSMSLLECNTIDGNKDIYIGDKTLSYESDYCK